MNKMKYLACAFAVLVACWPHLGPLAAPRCYPKTRFVVQTGGLVLDTLTQLVWQQDGSGTRAGCAQGTTCTWAEAKTYCAGLSLGGFSSGFRLPTVKELDSLLDLTVTSGATINQTAFPGTSATWFWTSSPCAGSSGCAWYVYFYSGFSDGYNVGDNLRVRCVR